MSNQIPWWLLPASGAALGGASGTIDALFDAEKSKRKLNTILSKALGGGILGGVAEGGRQAAHAGLDTMDNLPPKLQELVTKINTLDMS